MQPVSSLFCKAAPAAAAASGWPGLARAVCVPGLRRLTLRWRGLRAGDEHAVPLLELLFAEQLLREHVQGVQEAGAAGRRRRLLLRHGVPLPLLQVSHPGAPPLVVVKAGVGGSAGINLPMFTASSKGPRECPSRPLPLIRAGLACGPVIVRVSTGVLEGPRSGVSRSVRRASVAEQPSERWACLCAVMGWRRRSGRRSTTTSKHSPWSTTRRATCTASKNTGEGARAPAGRAGLSCPLRWGGCAAVVRGGVVGLVHTADRVL